MADDARGPSIGPSVAEILASHAGGTGSPTKTAARVADAIAARGDDGTWLSTVPRDQLLATAEEIEKRSGARTLPLYGVPFAVKDSIDVEGVPTTLSCPDYAVRVRVLHSRSRSARCPSRWRPAPPGLDECPRR